MTNNLLHGGTTNDEGFKSLSEELFEQIFRANPDVSSNGLVRAAVKAAEENPHTMEALQKKKEDDEDLTAQMIDADQNVISMREEALRREREEWANSEHELGGVKLNGDEWLELAESMRNDDKVKNAMIQHLMAQGLNKQQAEQKVKEYADAAAAMGKADCDKTLEDKAAIDKAKNDPLFKRTVEAGQSADANNRVISGNHDAFKSDISTSSMSGAEAQVAVLTAAKSDTNFKGAIEAAQHSMQFNLSVNAPTKSDNKSDDGGIQSVVRPTPAFTFAANGGNVATNAVAVGTSLQTDIKQNTQFSSLNQIPQPLAGGAL